MNAVETTLLVPVVVGMIRAATPVAYAALGAVINERSGLLNLGIEGLMLVGACVGVGSQLAFGNWIVSVMLAGGAAAVVGLIHALLCVKARTNQIVTGLALLFLCQGATAVYGARMVSQPVAIDVTRLTGVPPALQQAIDPMICGVVVLTVFIGFLMYRTSWGVALRAAGEDAESASAAGVPVQTVRIIAGTVSGACCGLGGAYLSLFYAGQWQEDMVAGRGWIALVMVIFGMWSPARVLVGTLLFGGLSALQLNLQARGVAFSPYLLGMLPFVATIAFLVAASWSLKRRPDRMPASLGKPFPPDSQA